MAKKKVKQKRKPKRTGHLKGNNFLIPRYIMNKEPLLPRLINYETTGIFIVIPLLVVSLIVIWKIFKYYDQPWFRYYYHFIFPCTIKSISMNKQDFHIPFLHSMVIIAAVTLVAMASSRYFVERYYLNKISTPVFTSASSELSGK